jgi:E3 ubiquitin-protein ligase RAD18
MLERQIDAKHCGARGGYEVSRGAAKGTGHGARRQRSNNKRKLEDTDMEDGEPVRQTRSRQTRSKGRRDESADDAPIEIADNDDGDDDFLPEGMAKCPICNTTMKAEQVYNHLDICPGQSASQGRSTRSRFVYT